MNSLFATLDTKPSRRFTRRKRITKTPLEQALATLKQREFSPCSVDAYKITVVNNRKEAAQRSEQVRHLHYCDVTRRNQYLNAVGVGAVLLFVVSAVLGLGCGAANWIATGLLSGLLHGWTLPTGWISWTGGSVLAVLVTAMFIRDMKWTDEVSKGRTLVYLIPGVSAITGAVLNYRAARLPYLKWQVVPMEEFEADLIPEPVKALCRRLREACPQVRFNVHYTAVDREQTPADILAQNAWWKIDPFIEATDGQKKAFVAVFDESGFRTA